MRTRPPDDRGFVDIRAPGSDKLLFRYHPASRVVEVERRREPIQVDLRQYDGYTGNVADDRS